MKRTDLLIDRSLRSVYQQSNINPRCIFVVDDNEKLTKNDTHSPEYWDIKKRVKEFRRNFLSERLGFPLNQIPDDYFHTTVIPNNRTHGNSGTGAWNTGAIRSLNFGNNNYLAILDDDDEWQPDYLRECLKKTKLGKKRKRKEYVAAVVTGILRKEQNRSVKIVVKKNSFTKRQFFIGNPGLQGSNIFIHLRTFWTIGGFDENLSSATDRDLAIRLIEFCQALRYPKIRFREKSLVMHHAYSSDRVTTNPRSKENGLRSFYRKYLPFMTKKEKELSLERAHRLFNFNIDDGNNEIIDPSPKREICNDGFDNLSSDPLYFLVGMTSRSPENLRESLSQFSTLMEHPLVKDHKIVILENTDDKLKIRPIIRYLAEEYSLSIRLITIEEQQRDRIAFPHDFLFSKERIHKKSIAFSRSLLQWYLYQMTQELNVKNIVNWIVDDDSIPECLILDRDSDSISIHQPDYVKEILKQKNDNMCDAVLGTVTDAPPLPFLSSIRTQLLDLQFNLKWFQQQDPNDIFKLKAYENYCHMNHSMDYYYDLSSKEYGHLETPFWWLPLEMKEMTVGEAFHMYLKEIILISDGVNVHRPIFIDGSRFGAVTGPSIYRGGNTIIFDPEMLIIPNYSPRMQWKKEKESKEIVLRRSDFNWAIYQTKVHERKINQVILPLRHHRRLQTSTFTLSETKIVRDIFGLVLYRSLQKLLQDKTIEEINENGIKKAQHFFTTKLREAMRNLKINNQRARFLSWSAKNILADRKNWWFGNEQRINLNGDLQKAISAINTLKFEIGKRKFGELLSNIERNMNLNKQFIIPDFIKNLKRINNQTLVEKIGGSLEPFPEAIIKDE